MAGPEGGPAAIRPVEDALPSAEGAGIVQRMPPIANLAEAGNTMWMIAALTGDFAVFHDSSE